MVLDWTNEETADCMAWLRKHPEARRILKDCAGVEDMAERLQAFILERVGEVDFYQIATAAQYEL